MTIKYDHKVYTKAYQPKDSIPIVTASCKSEVFLDVGNNPHQHCYLLYQQGS